MKVGLRGDDKDVLLAVVAPEVTKGPGNGEEGNFVDRGGSSDGTSVAELRSVPNNARHSRLVDHLQTEMLRHKHLRSMRITFPPAASILANSFSSSGLWSLR